MRWHHKRIGKRIMIQWSRAIGPLTFGVHASCKAWSAIRGCYVDFHLPFCVLTFGNIDSVEYPSEWWASARDMSTGVHYDDHDI